MADAPQLVGPVAPGGVGLYYVAPPNGDYNVAAAFMSSYLQQRVPQANAVFAAKLKAMDPSSRYATLAKLQAERTKLLEALAAGDRNRNTNATTLQKSASDLVGEALKLEGMNVSAQSAVSVARTNQETELLKDRRVTSEGGKAVVQDVSAVLGETRDALARAAQMPAGAARQRAELDAWTTYDKRMAGAQAAMQQQVTNPGEREAIRENVQTLLSGVQLSDPKTVEQMKRIGQSNFPAPADLPVNRYGARARDFNTIVAEARDAAGLLKQPVGTGTEPTPAAVPEGASRPASPGGGPPQPAPASSGGGSGAAPSGARRESGAAPRQAGSPSAGAAPSQGRGNTTVSTSASTASGGDFPSDEKLLEGVSVIDALIEELKAEDPMTPLDRLSQRLGTGVGFRTPGAPRRQRTGRGLLNVSTSRDARPRKGKAADAAAFEDPDYEFPVEPADGVIPDPTKPIRRTVESTVRGLVQGKKRPTDKAAAFLGPDYGPPDIRESEQLPDPDLGESDPTVDYRESESVPLPPERGMDFGMNSRRMPTEPVPPGGAPPSEIARAAQFIGEELRLERERALNDVKRTANSMRR